MNISNDKLWNLQIHVLYTKHSAFHFQNGSFTKKKKSNLCHLFSIFRMEILSKKKNPYLQTTLVILFHKYIFTLYIHIYVYKEIVIYMCIPAPTFLAYYYYIFI